MYFKSDQRTSEFGYLNRIRYSIGVTRAKLTQQIIAVSVHEPVRSQ